MSNLCEECHGNKFLIETTEEPEYLKVKKLINAEVKIAREPNSNQIINSLAGYTIRNYEIHNENVLLLAKMNRICRTKGETCNWNPNAHLRKSNLYVDNIIITEREIENKRMAKNLSKVQSSVPSFVELKQQWNFDLKMIKKKAKRQIILPEIMTISEKYDDEKDNHRPLIYLDLGVLNGSPLGRLFIKLYVDFAPLTVKRFIDLCENHRNKTSVNKNRLCLIGSVLDHIFPGLYAKGGNLNFNREGQYQYIKSYKPENFLLNHNCPGTLSMHPNSDGLVATEFSISFKPLPFLNGKRCAFGRVVNSLNILAPTECYGTKNGKPNKMVQITNCGIFKLNL